MSTTILSYTLFVNNTNLMLNMDLYQMLMVKKKINISMIKCVGDISQKLYSTLMKMLQVLYKLLTLFILRL